jgi:hypothetical protein
MRCVSHSGIDGLGVIRPILIGQMSIEGNARVVSILGVYLASSFAAATSAKTLPIRRRRGSFAPVLGERDTVLKVDEFGQRLRIGFVSDVPGDKPGELRQTRVWTGFSHFPETQISCISQNGR